MLILITILLGIALDQGSKFAALQLRDLPGGTYPLIPDVFHLTYAENRGAAFGILQGQQWLLVAMTLVVVAIMLFHVYHEKDKPRIYKFMVACLIAGALGNLIDRVRIGYVIDFFDCRFIQFAIFNVADTLVCCSVAGLCIYYIFFYGKEKRALPGADEQPKGDAHE
ncbi:signal peptidase II [Christensenellaceae bacterium NSJ-44]|uniref:Lipoprotein signal peptidase n=1 Tax=Luoshenia tenuis TaxID=2763654 RepID=A0A926D1U6_9FIRM|nr:signal peptidase II [Luoshenia tenuis]MBC8528765.1 signal peptidase II [Luoshenia tenuis]